MYNAVYSASGQECAMYDTAYSLQQLGAYTYMRTNTFSGSTSLISFLPNLIVPQSIRLNSICGYYLGQLACNVVCLRTKNAILQTDTCTWRHFWCLQESSPLYISELGGGSREEYWLRVLWGFKENMYSTLLATLSSYDLPCIEKRKKMYLVMMSLGLNVGMYWKCNGFIW